jgi:hypothetical protein
MMTSLSSHALAKLAANDLIYCQEMQWVVKIRHVFNGKACRLDKLKGCHFAAAVRYPLCNCRYKLIIFYYVLEYSVKNSVKLNVNGRHEVVFLAFYSELCDGLSTEQSKKNLARDENGANIFGVER